MTQDWQHICRTLQTALFKLRAEGPDGFEGFIRDAYREATGISLRLQKPGPQGGIDAVSGRLTGEIATGVEAKRYRETTSLSLDELKYKLIDAATRNSNPIELWILVASKEVSGDDEAELRRVGDQHGLGVLVLDWLSDAGPIAPLPLLIALAPNTVRQRLGEDIADSIRVLTQHPEFEVQKSQLLDRLRHPDLGLCYAAKAVRQNIGQTLRSRADAKSKLQNSVDLGSESRIWAPRDGLCAAIQEWSRHAADTPICALIGEEGAGKTWLMFDWWSRHLEEPPPLILWLSAREVASSSLSEVIGAALSKWVSVPRRDVDFWARRVELWRRTHKGHSTGPFIWLMLDGTNEGTAQEQVLKFLSEAVNSEWKGAVGILLSDRPAHWERAFNGGKSLETAPISIPVSQFSDAELDALLAKHGKSREDFSAEVLKIIKWPSWFAVAAQLFAQEHDWSTHSVEQLMLRYVQHRLKERTQVSIMDDEVFRTFISGLGAEMQANWENGKQFSRTELTQRLADYIETPGKSILDAVDDITSGIWMQRESLNRFRIDKTILPFAISLALLNQLRSSTTEEEADSESERFLGPIEDQDLGANILGAAVSLAFIDPVVFDHTRKALLKRWINAHNFARRHFDLLWRIGSAAPQSLFSVAEDLWLQQAGGYSIDEILIKGIANIATDGGRQIEVVEFLTKWAATYWLDPRQGEFIGYHPVAQEAADAMAITIDRLQRLRVDIGENALIQARLFCCDNGVGASWTFYRVLSIATYLPRAVQVPMWRGWVFSRAVMGRRRHFDDLAWSLRINPFDGAVASQALLETVDKLLALPSEGVSEMTLALLEAHGGPEAAEKLSSIGEALQTRLWSLHEEEAQLFDGIVTIIDNRGRSNKELAFLLSKFASNPDAHISDNHIDQLERYAQAFPVAELGDGRGQTSASIDLELAEPALARWAPHALAELYRRYLLTLRGRDESRLLGLTFALDGLLILSTTEVHEQVDSTLISRMSSKEDGQLDQIDRALWRASLFDKSPVVQRELWASIGAPREVPTTLEHLVRPGPVGLLRTLERELHPSCALDRLVSWLGYLVCSSPVQLPEDWEVLWRLFDHEDGTVRYLAFDLALKSEDKQLAQRLFATNWTSSQSRGFLENWAGSSLLALAATPENFVSISQRIEPQWSAILWERLGYDPAYSSPFEGFLRSSVQRELNPPASRTYPEYRCSPEQATLKLLDLKPADITELADRLFEAKYVSAFSQYEWPRMELLHAFFSKNPSRASSYWKKMDARKGGFRSTSEAFDELPFEAEDCDDVDGLRDNLLKRAHNDWQLITLGTIIARQQRADWAVRRIRQLLAQPACPGDIARAIMLAGFLDDSAAARNLWARELSGPPLDGWLGVVYRDAKQHIERAWRALEWLDRMLSADTDEHFFAYWRLFLRSIDRRVVPIAFRRLEATLDSMSPRRKDFIALNWAAVVEGTQKAKSDYERTLFSIRTGYRWALPWGSSS